MVAMSAVLNASSGRQTRTLTTAATLVNMNDILLENKCTEIGCSDKNGCSFARVSTGLGLSTIDCNSNSHCGPAITCLAA